MTPRTHVLALSLAVISQTVAAQSPAADASQLDPPPAPQTRPRQVESAEAQAFRRHAMLRGVELDDLHRRYERRGRALTAVGAFFLIIGAGAGIAAAAIGDQCDDDDWLCFPIGPLLGIPAGVVGAIGIGMLGLGARKRRRARAMVSLGLANARLHLQF